MSKTSWKVKDRYNKEHYVRFSLQVDKSIGEPFKVLCESQGVSYSKVISDLMIYYMRLWDSFPLDDVMVPQSNNLSRDL